MTSGEQQLARDPLVGAHNSELWLNAIRSQTGQIVRRKVKSSMYRAVALKMLYKRNHWFGIMMWVVQNQNKHSNVKV